MHPTRSTHDCITLYSNQQAPNVFKAFRNGRSALVSLPKHEDTWTASASLRVDLSLLKPLIRAERADG